MRSSLACRSTERSALEDVLVHLSPGRQPHAWWQGRKAPTTPGRRPLRSIPGDRVLGPTRLQREHIRDRPDYLLGHGIVIGWSDAGVKAILDCPIQARWKAWNVPAPTLLQSCTGMATPFVASMIRLPFGPSQTGETCYPEPVSGHPHGSQRPIQVGVGVHLPAFGRGVPERLHARLQASVIWFHVISSRLGGVNVYRPTFFGAFGGTRVSSGDVLLYWATPFGPSQ